MIVRKESNIIRHFLVAFATALLLLVALSANAQDEAAAKTDAEDKPTVVWGGVSLASYANTPEEQRKAMPVIGEMLMCKNTAEGCGGVDVNAVALKALGNRQFRDFNVKVGNVSVNQVQGYIVTPVITSEAVVEAFEGKSVGYSYSFRIFGNLMILQFLPGEVKYVAAAPFILNHFDIQPRRLNAKQKNDVFRSLYLNNQLGVNYFNKLFESAKKRLRINETEHNYVQVNEVELAPEVRDVLTKSHGADSWKQQIANFFEAQLAEVTGSPILPSALGQQTTQQLKIVFRNGATKLVVPPAGYGIGLFVERFLRHEMKSSYANERIVCFMVALSVKVTDPYEDQIGNLRFTRKQDSCGATELGTTRDGSMYFPESMYSLLYRIAQQFGGDVDAKFMRRNIENPKQATTKVRSLSKVMFN